MTQVSVPKPVMAFDSIQYLRALAALMVVVFHVRPRLEHMGYAGGWPGWLSCGVDIFFVISGFIMWTTTCDRPMRPNDFLVRRFLRIAPLYYLVTAVVIVTMLAAPMLVSSGRFDLVHTIASFAFFPHLNVVTGDFDPVLPQGWTLDYEMAFYALFALGLFVARPFRQMLILGALVAIAVAGHWIAKATALGFYTDSIILEFGFGILIAMATARGMRLPVTVAFVCLAAGAVGIVLTWPIVVSGVPRVWLSGVAAALLVLGAVNWDQARGIGSAELPRLLGDASYSIYLTHGLILTAIGVVWSRTPFADRSWAMIVFSMIAVFAASIGGIIVYWLAERPLHDWARRLTRRGGRSSARRRTDAIETAPSSIR